MLKLCLVLLWSVIGERPKQLIVKGNEQDSLVRFPGEAIEEYHERILRHRPYVDLKRWIL